MKKFYLFFSVFLCFFKVHCQTYLPEIIASGGGYMSTSQFSNSFTIGEMCLIETFQVGASTLTQGFQQPDAVIPNPPNAEVYIPNGITPNGDGINDSWLIPDLVDRPYCTVKIFNRWGQLLFSNVGYTQQWDGTYHGNLLPSADYYYVITLEDGSGKEYTGTITIKR